MKSRPVTALAAVLLLSSAACETEGPSRLDRWTRELGDVAPGAETERLEALRARDGLPLSFWAGEVVEGGPEVEAIRGEHPCGPVALAFVRRIPGYEPGAPLESELVAEIGSGGDVAGTWSIPVDVVVVGVRGEDLLCAASFDRGDAPPISVRLAVRPDGSYRVESNEPSLPEPGTAECPALGLWGESAYVRCWRYRDADSGVARTIAYQGPCT